MVNKDASTFVHLLFISLPITPKEMATGRADKVVNGDTLTGKEVVLFERSSDSGIFGSGGPWS